MFFARAHDLPLAPLFFAALIFALALLLEIRVLRFAYMRLGVSSGAAILLLFASLIGSAVNIPVAVLGTEPLARSGEFLFFVKKYVAPQPTGAPGVVLAINVGGALIPTLLSAYLLAKRRIWGAGLVAVGIMALVCHALAQPVAGVGIALPTFVPPVAATLVAAIVSWREMAPLAYIGGSLGVLIGADLTNLDTLQGLGAPVASIGGAGTFDGIFVAGLFAVLLASIARPGETQA
jgi:uncharacterized membrane protein